MMIDLGGQWLMNDQQMVTAEPDVCSCNRGAEVKVRRRAHSILFGIYKGATVH